MSRLTTSILLLSSLALLFSLVPLSVNAQCCAMRGSDCAGGTHCVEDGCNFAVCQCHCQLDTVWIVIIVIAIFLACVACCVLCRRAYMRRQIVYVQQPVAFGQQPLMYQPPQQNFAGQPQQFGATGHPQQTSDFPSQQGYHHQAPQGQNAYAPQA